MNNNKKRASKLCNIYDNAHVAMTCAIYANPLDTTHTEKQSNNCLFF